MVLAWIQSPEWPLEAAADSAAFLLGAGKVLWFCFPGEGTGWNLESWCDLVKTFVSGVKMSQGHGTEGNTPFPCGLSCPARASLKAPFLTNDLLYG